MFTAIELQKLMKAQPFQPFKVKMSNGDSYEIPHHDAAFVTRNWLEIGTDIGSDKIPGSVCRCAILHIAQIEELAAA